jgi:hypothetical protein
MCFFLKSCSSSSTSGNTNREVERGLRLEGRRRFVGPRPVPQQDGHER